MEKLKNLLRPYTPFFLLAVCRFLNKLLYTWRRNFLFRFFSFYRAYINKESTIQDIKIDKKSEVYALLKENWKNYEVDRYPKDARMDTLRKKDVIGMSTENIRFFINEAVRRFAKGGVYLEVGTFHGCSLLSAALFNYSTRCIGIDNFRAFNEEGKNEFLLKENLEKFNNPTNIEFYKQDYKVTILDLFSKEPDLKVNVYYYDGPHDYKDQVKGLSIMLPYLAHKCIILVDDLDQRRVEEANKHFVKENPNFKSVFKIRTKMWNSKYWWCGFEVIARGL